MINIEGVLAPEEKLRKGCDSMKRTITPGQISRTNLELIYDYIYKNGPASLQDISYDLRLSRPTIASKISDLEAMGMIKKEGQIPSELVGRKAIAYTVVPDYRLAIGIEIQENQFKILTVDLTGGYFLRKVIPLSYANTDEYIKTLCSLINEYIDSLALRDGQLLGIGISIPGLVSADGSEVTYGRILECTGLKLSKFQQHLAFPCRFLHDAGAAAGSELWASPELSDFVYLNISIHLGASLICNREIFTGMHGYAATFEHVQFSPDGPVCYCGKKGCIEMYISMTALLIGDDEDRFFEKLRNGDPVCRERWLQYLHHLARAINNSRLLYDTVYVVGGYLAQHLIAEDLDILYDEIERISPFPEYRDYIQVSKMPVHNITIGAALPYINEFLENPAPNT